MVSKLSHPAYRPADAYLWNLFAQAHTIAGEGLRVFLLTADPLTPISSHAAERLARLQLRLREFAALRSGWDSYGAEAPTTTAVNAAREELMSLAVLLAENTEAAEVVPTVFPMRDGGIQLDLDTPSGAIEVEIAPDGTRTYTYFEPGTEASETLMSLREALARLTNVATALELAG